MGGISYKKLAANAKIYRSVSDAISEGIAFVASSTSPEYAGISMHHVLVKLSAAGGVYDDVQARAAIASPDTADPMVLWSKMVTSSQDIRRTVETKISFANGIGLVATGPIAISGGIKASSEKDGDADSVTTPAPASNNTRIATVSNARGAFASALLIATTFEIAVLSS